VGVVTVRLAEPLLRDGGSLLPLHTPLIREDPYYSVTVLVRLWFCPKRQLSLPLCKLNFALSGRQQFHIAGKLAQNL
jgi:hypothetical protein